MGQGEQLAGLAARYQDAIRVLPGFDLIPRQWLHITMQGLAFVDDILPEDLASVLKTTRAALTEVEPFTLTFDRPLIRPEAIALVPEDVEPLNDLRLTVRSAVEKAVGPGVIDLGPTDFQPHVSFAYVNAEPAAADVLARLYNTPSRSATFRVDAVPLIEMHRDNRMYEWREIDSLALKNSARASDGP